MTDFDRLVAVLADGAVEHIVIGGMAAVAHGSAHFTVDLDIVNRRTVPFQFDATTIRRGLNFTLVTAAGDLDVLGKAAGGGTYDALLPRSEVRELFGREVRFVDLDGLIHLKRSAGRPKDMERIVELEALREERDRR